jgi:hypothetical protein
MKMVDEVSEFRQCRWKYTLGGGLGVGCLHKGVGGCCDGIVPTLDYLLKCGVHVVKESTGVGLRCTWILNLCIKVVLCELVYSADQLM